MLAFAALAVETVAAQPELRPVDAGTEDTSVNRLSGLVPRIEQRSPTGFDQVYEMIKPGGERVFVRISGGVYAEFDRSVYSFDGETEVPPGTVFRIGRPGQSPAITPVAASNRVDLSADAGGAEASDLPLTASGASTASAIGEPSIMGNELYRSVRISQLLFSTVKAGSVPAE